MGCHHVCVALACQSASRVIKLWRGSVLWQTDAIIDGTL
jgi:hypothetical protein